MAVTKPTDKITFTFVKADLFEAVSNESLLAVSNMKAEGLDYDDFWMDVGKNDIFEKLLSEVHSLISLKLSKITAGLSDSFVNGVTDVSYTINDKTAYNGNILDHFDELINQVIQNYILKEWFLTNGLADKSKQYSEKFAALFKELIRNTVSLRKTTIV